MGIMEFFARFQNPILKMKKKKNISLYSNPLLYRQKDNLLLFKITYSFGLQHII